MLLVLGSVLFCLAALEMGVRIVRGSEGLTDWDNIVRRDRVLTRTLTNAMGQYDPLLGFVGSPSYSAPDFHYDARGLRVTPAPAGVALAEPPILAVGGSYTLGHDVADGETYPARLQALTGRRVINAGMEAYGLDQMVLRAEAVAAEDKPAAIVLSLGADNLRRVEMSRVWGIEKPYFTSSDGSLALHNVPVPPSPDPATTLDLWQRLFGRSLLVDLVLRHFGWQYEWSVDHVRVLPRGEGVRMACPLFARIARLGVPGIVVAEYDPYLWVDPSLMSEHRQLTDSALRCAAAAGFVTIDPFEAIDRGMRTGGPHFYYGDHEHPNAAGQELVAGLIAEAIPSLKLPTRTAP